MKDYIDKLLNTWDIHTTQDTLKNEDEHKAKKKQNPTDDVRKEWRIKNWKYVVIIAETFFVLNF